MGTEVQLERQRYMPGYCSARDLGEDVSSNPWNYYERQFQGTTVDLYSENDKDGLKQKMLEHDAVFRKQVSELHRLYRTQRDLMEEMKRSELHNHRLPFLNPMVYQRQDSTKMQAPIFPSSNSACTSPSNLVSEHSSPNLSHLKRKKPKTDFLSVKDLDGSTDCEIIECRPGKVRRKMFDLELPADEYIHPVDLDQGRDENARCPSFPNSCYNGQSFLGGRSMSSSRGNGCRPSSELIQIEDDPPTLDLLNHGTLRNNLGTDSLSLRTPPKYNSRGTSAISCHGGDYMDSRKTHLGDRESIRAHASHQLSLGKFNTKDSSLSQYLKLENSLDPSRHIHGINGTLRGTTFPVLPDNSKEGFWNDRVVGYEHVSGTQHYGTNHSWSQPMASWDNYGSNSTQKQPYFISSVGLRKGCQASNQPSKPAEEKLNINSGYVVGIPRRDLDHGSSSGSKEDSICYPSVKFENLGSCRDGLKYSKGLNGFDLNSSGGMNLNAAAANDSLHETTLHQNLVVANQMDQSGKAALLPWLKPTHFISDITRANSSTDHSSKTIYGFPEVAQPLAVGNLRPSKGGKSDMKQIHQIFDMNLPGETDANLENTVDEIADTKVTGFKNLFDLNSCLPEDEPSAHSASSVARNIRGIDLEAPAPVDFDEDIAFAMMQQTQQEAEFEHVAAEAILSFSSLKKSCTSEKAYTATETLKWFVGVISSHPSEISEEPIARISSDEIDDFELTTLKLTGMSAEESMPTTAFPPIPNIEEEEEELTTALIGARPRRGQSRRGRPKRDFQRDILPGIASLSRHEVTEDFQAFDGLMRAGGHCWQFGKRAAARNKPRRGRPRTVNLAPVPDPVISSPPAQPTASCVKSGMKESNLTSWGKTTRRPRRQRCPAGNPQPIRLS